MEILEKFICCMYGAKGNDVDDARYRLYCQSEGKIGCEYLPPCKDVLLLHAKRSNYQAPIWRESIIQYQNNLHLQQNGWIVDESGDLDLKWMTCNPAPDEILELRAAVKGDAMRIVPVSYTRFSVLICVGVATVETYLKYKSRKITKKNTIHSRKKKKTNDLCCFCLSIIECYLDILYSL